MYLSLILLSGGKGFRFGEKIPKQYLPFFDKPLILHSFDTFLDLEELQEIIVVCDEEYQPLFTSSNTSLKFAKPGKTRQDSVKQGAAHLTPKSTHVLIHDGARPLIEKEDIKTLIQVGKEYGAATLGFPIKETIKQLSSKQTINKTLERSSLWKAYTPQFMKTSLLHQGLEYADANELQVTDDVSLVEHLGYPIKMVQGKETNIKITTPLDLAVAHNLYAKEKI